jgi:hypothetical protein
VNEVYPQVYTFSTASGSTVVQNIELVATKDTDRLSVAELRRRNDQRDIGIDLADEVESYRDPPRTDDVPTLRDDRAPVDSLLDPMAGQEYVVEQAPPNGSEAA